MKLDSWTATSIFLILVAILILGLPFFLGYKIGYSTGEQRMFEVWKESIK